MSMSKRTIGILGLLAAGGLAFGIAAMSAESQNYGQAESPSFEATRKIAAGCNTCRWYGEYDTFAQARAAASAHLAANPDHDAGVIGR